MKNNATPIFPSMKEIINISKMLSLTNQLENLKHFQMQLKITKYNNNYNNNEKKKSIQDFFFFRFHA